MSDEEDMKPIKIAVVGAGAIGLSTALCIQDRIRNCDVNLIADKFSPSTTSDGSAGLWTPFLVPEDQIEMVTRWSMETYTYLLEKFRSEDAYRYGVQLISGFNFCQEVKTDPPWCKDVLGFRRLGEEELKLYPGKEFGIFYTAFTLDVPSLLSSFMRKFREQGGFVISKKLGSLQELFRTEVLSERRYGQIAYWYVSCNFFGLSGRRINNELAGKDREDAIDSPICPNFLKSCSSIESSYDIIVNCTGIGSAELLNDTKVKPKRGQVIRVRAPWIKHFYIDIDKNDDVTYILPGIDTVVLGGTAQDGDWNTEDDPADIEGIMERCLKVMPSLKDSKRLGTWAGLRPYRESVRLEIDRNTNPSKTKIIHNYGHAGAGLTIFWGCAKDAADLVMDLVKIHKSKM